MNDNTTTDRAAKAEALLLYFTAEAHRRKWNYDRGLDDDGVPIKSEAFDALHRLGEEMRVELERLRRLGGEAAPDNTETQQDGPEEPTEEQIVRNHVTTLHLIGEQLADVESWVWEQLAKTRAATASEEPGR
jgi:hypothetical protein